jgi:hypothetical protein
VALQLNGRAVSTRFFDDIFIPKSMLFENTELYVRTWEL